MTIETTPTEPTADTIPLATDADFAAAEAELVRLLADADETLKTTPDDKWPEVQARWWAYHEALLTAEPRTPLQAAIVLRRVLCQHCGLPSGSNDMNLPAITRVAGFLTDVAATEKEHNSAFVTDHAVFEVAMAMMKTATRVTVPEVAKRRSAILAVQDDIEALAEDMKPLPYLVESVAQRLKNPQAKVALNWLASALTTFRDRLMKANWDIDVKYRHQVYGRNAKRDEPFKGYPSVPAEPAPTYPFPSAANEAA